MNLEHAIFVQSRLLQPAKCHYANFYENVSESKKLCGSSERLG